MNYIETLNSLGKKAVLDLIKKAGIREYGSLNEDLTEKIETFLAQRAGVCEPVIVAGGLNNHDFSGMLLKIVREEPKKVIRGLETLAYLTDAETKILYLPEGETALAEDLKKAIAERNLEIDVRTEIADARLLRDNLICHVETLAAVADAVEDCYKPGTLVSVVRYTDSRTVGEELAPRYTDFGTPLKELTGNLENVKAVQVGDILYRPEEAEELRLTKELPLGDGVIRLYENGCCLLDIAKAGLLESRRKSCGKCTFCREGLLQLYTRIKEITDGKGDAASPAIMEEIGEAMTFSGSCSLGNSGSSFVLETLKKFDNEYTDHIKKKKCTAGTCLAFVNMYIDPEKCSGCGACIPSCPENFIEGLPGYIHMIEDIDCTKCGACMKACPQDAIVRTTGQVPGLPDRLTRVGRFKRY